MEDKEKGHKSSGGTCLDSFVQINNCTRGRKGLTRNELSHGRTVKCTNSTISDNQSTKDADNAINCITESLMQEGQIKVKCKSKCK